MPKSILLLEDDPDRIVRFHAVIRAAWPDMAVHHWRSAHRMIAECPPQLASCALVCLDHDLVPGPGSGADALVGFGNPAQATADEGVATTADPGDGMDAARFLAAAGIRCPVLIHSSNADGAYRMRGELELAGCTVRSVLPFGAEWIERYWRACVEEMLAE